MSHIRLIAWSLTIGIFVFVSATASAQLLPERLVPPQSVSVPPLPMTEQPATRRPAGAEKIPAHLWALPTGVFPGAPTAISPERLPANWQRPVLDTPALASERDPTCPAVPRQPMAQNAFVSTFDALKVHVLDRFLLAAEPAARFADDPTVGSTHGFITTAVPLATPNAAPFLRLGIADPFEQLRAIRLVNPPADSDPPDASRESPAVR